MKKVVALALALVLALSLGVSAFATFDPKALQPLTLGAADADYASEKAILKTLEPDDDGNFICGPDGGTFYFTLYIPEDNLGDDGKLNAKDEYTYAFDEDGFDKEFTGGLEVDIVEFDPDTMSSELYSYKIVEYTKGSDGKWTVTDDDVTLVTDTDILEVIAEYESDDKAGNAIASKSDYALFDNKNYEYVCAVADYLNDNANSNKKYEVETKSEYADYLLKVVVPENYGVAYTEGTFTVSAVWEKTTLKDAAKGTKKVSTKEVEYEGTIYTDVVIFTYDDVNTAVKKQVNLTVGQDGYSDYSTQGKYNQTDNKYMGTPEDVATVVSTTAFRALRENNYSLVVSLAEDKDGYKVNNETANYIDVCIKEVAAAQKGVNFAGYSMAAFNKEDRVLSQVDNKLYDLSRKDLNNADKELAYLGFGFYGNQVIASDFTITYDLGINAAELRESFGKAVEEEDIITYYIVKDGKVLDTFTIDYLDEDNQAYKAVKLEIAGKAGDTLGEYRIQLTAPAGAEGEENPNTGAESVVGVVAALAVVSLASAAAISLKK